MEGSQINAASNHNANNTNNNYPRQVTGVESQIGGESPQNSHFIIENLDRQVKNLRKQFANTFESIEAEEVYKVKQSRYGPATAAAIESNNQTNNNFSSRVKKH